MILRQNILPVTRQTELPRYMRPDGAYDGLIDLYSSIGAYGNVGVEVGCFWGESAEIAAQFLGTLYCVDPWLDEADYQQFRRRMARFTNVVKLRVNSDVAAKKFDKSSIDIVYIDANHDYEQVRQDIMLWSKIVRDGGWITGHDYDELEGHEGVCRAVDELLGAPKLRFSDGSFAVQKRSHDEALHPSRT